MATAKTKLRKLNESAERKKAELAYERASAWAASPAGTPYGYGQTAKGAKA